MCAMEGGVSNCKSVMCRREDLKGDACGGGREGSGGRYQYGE